MTHRKINLLALLLLTGMLSASLMPAPEWGFFGHRRINRMAVFTLPAEMMVLYKPYIEVVTEHAVDPDKRRYATRHEAVRHYIDIDHWGKYPYPAVPRAWDEVLARYATVHLYGAQDTMVLFVDSLSYGVDKQLSLHALDGSWQTKLPIHRYRQCFRRNILPIYYEDVWPLVVDSLAAYIELPPMTIDRIEVMDHFSAYGIVPYYLPQHMGKLTAAFRRGDTERILQLSAEMGHYVGDAHVPLHTTTNYNGQLTNQVGIHAFWESRIPELFADTDYDYLVGQASYIDDMHSYFWDIVLASHRLVDSVLLIEKELSQTFPSDLQYCFEERLDLTVRTQCRAYAKAYQDRMQGMVENRMQDAIKSVGDCWYTAWIDAGQPDLRPLVNKDIARSLRDQQEKLDDAYQKGNIKGRPHDN